MAKKSLEQFPEDQEDLRVESLPEIFPEIGTEKGREAGAENPEDNEQEIEMLKQEIEDETTEQPLNTKPEAVENRAQKIKEYQEKYLPDHLRKKGKSLISKVITRLWTRGAKFDQEGKENLPEKGPFVVTCNHFGGGDPESLLETFKNVDLHFAVAKEIWWNQSAIVRWFLKKFGTIPIEESLSNLTEEQKEAALKNQGKAGKVVFRKIIDREKAGGVAMNTEFIHQAVALLSRGDAVGIFPEGLWLNPEGPAKLREKQELKQGYRGIELVASQYKKLTGEELPIIPTAFVEDRKTGNKKVIVGKSLLLSENDSQLNDTDWCMAHVAEMLPEEQRGYYKDAVEKK